MKINLKIFGRRLNRNQVTNVSGYKLKENKNQEIAIIDFNGVDEASPYFIRQVLTKFLEKKYKKLEFLNSKKFDLQIRQALLELKNNKL